MTPMLDCDAVMRQLWDYLDGELTPDRMDSMREHLALCARCHPQLDFERSFLDVLARVRREPSNLGRIRERVLNTLQAEGFSPA